MLRWMILVAVLVAGVAAPAEAARQLGAPYARARQQGRELRSHRVSGAVRGGSRGTIGRSRVASRGVSRGGARITFPRGAPSIDARATFDGSSTGNFIVDTGATSVALSGDFARRMGLDLRRAQRTTVMTASGPETAYATRVARIELGGAVAEDVPVVVMESLNGQGSDGLLGMSFLSRFVMRLDAHAGVLELDAPP